LWPRLSLIGKIQFTFASSTINALTPEDGAILMQAKSQDGLKDGQHCTVVGGTHAGKSGTVADINTSKTGHITITVIQTSGERFKTLAKNVVVHKGDDA
jgi:ribosomal protein S4E